MAKPIRTARVLPGFGLSLGYSLTYLSLVVLLPLTALVVKTTGLGWHGFWKIVSHPHVISAYKLTFGASLVAGIVNLVFGFIVAWTLVRYRFPGRRLLDAMIDMPFALPTAVSGIALATIFAPSGWVGQYLEPLGIKAAYSPLGVTIALAFIGLPFVVRTLQPALADLESESEEAAASLGASRWQTFRRVIVPAVLPAALTGFALSVARGLGEYGSVIFISSNKPGQQVVAQVIMNKLLEKNGIAAAAAIAMVMLGSALILLLAVNALQWWLSRHGRRLA